MLAPCRRRVERTDRIRFLARCRRKRRLNQASSVLYLIVGFFWVCFVILGAFSLCCVFSAFRLVVDPVRLSVPWCKRLTGKTRTSVRNDLYCVDGAVKPHTHSLVRAPCFCSPSPKTTGIYPVEIWIPVIQPRKQLCNTALHFRTNNQNTSIQRLCAICKDGRVLRPSISPNVEIIIAYCQSHSIIGWHCITHRFRPHVTTTAHRSKKHWKVEDTRDNSLQRYDWSQPSVAPVMNEGVRRCDAGLPRLMKRLQLRRDCNSAAMRGRCGRTIVDYNAYYLKKTRCRKITTRCSLYVSTSATAFHRPRRLVVKVVTWSRGGGAAHLTKPGWSKPHTHSTPN